MVEAELEFGDGTLERVLTTLVTLSPSLRPTHFSDGDEDDISSRQLIDGSRKSVKFLSSRSTGFFLFGPTLTCSLSVVKGKALRVYCSIDGESSLATQFLGHMAQAQPIFGFACTREEREQRNRVVTKQGISTVESWVGRDPERCTPGLYWLTLLPTVLAEKHGVSLSEIRRIAKEYAEPYDGQHLFRFYERPDDWRTDTGVAEFCSSSPGFFDIERVRPKIMAAKNFLDLHAILRDWK
jgi:hypothetical protein